MRVRFNYQRVGLVLMLAMAFGPLALAKTASPTTKPVVKKSAKAHAVAARSAHSSSKAKHGKKYASKRKSSWKNKGQKTIASERTREIQEALIRERYMSGSPDGQWDSRTQDAMRRFQAQQGWQTKVLPDSRALIKLGLGPDHSDILNPETAATSPYQPGGGEKSSIVNTISPATAAVRNQ